MFEMTNLRRKMSFHRVSRHEGPVWPQTSVDAFWFRVRL